MYAVALRRGDRPSCSPVIGSWSIPSIRNRCSSVTVEPTRTPLPLLRPASPWPRKRPGGVPDCARYPVTADAASSPPSALVRYSAQSGTPPGRFLGQGLAGLNNGKGVLVGSTVTEEHLFRMLGMLQDPITGEQLGRSPRRSATAYIDSRGVARKVSPASYTH